ncbi:TetR/AcrR family transcriptional regulator [Streptomyces sp. CJ_13]|uniref:TetR/AcrR family transcriptional regulator n=1 Tax=Streptomyces TaxID=1883 RepID=UPI000F3A8B42|nr:MULTISPECIES: TetR/AcrR family transcriptional regulator [unclassified Streptomyces]AYV32422.1 Transcriptional regulator, TetR family [Streptomyces sp. ADI95-16]MBT1186257.1 TetR/AcrR family transcriptional regulator [Streptomyces sp. CJ_13]
MTETTRERPLRADAERTVRTILEVAERVLGDDPTASLGQIAAAAGVARTTVHRRFASREALIDAMAAHAFRQVEEAIDIGRPETAPPLVALHQITANVIQIKSGWRYTVGQPQLRDPSAIAAHERIFAKGNLLMRRAQQAGLLRPDADLGWARRVYHALIEQAILEQAESSADPDTLAAAVVDALLNGLGPKRF